MIVYGAIRAHPRAARKRSRLHPHACSPQFIGNDHGAANRLLRRCEVVLIRAYRHEGIDCDRPAHWYDAGHERGLDEHHRAEGE